MSIERIPGMIQIQRADTREDTDTGADTREDTDTGADTREDTDTGEDTREDTDTAGVDTREDTDTGADKSIILKLNNKSNNQSHFSN